VTKLLAHFEYDRTMSPGEFSRKDAEACGRDELQLIREHKELRPHAEITRLCNGSHLVRWFRRVAVIFLPVSDIVLALLNSIARSLGQDTSAEQILRYRHGLWRLNGAMEVAGGWEKLMDELGRRLPVLLYHSVGPLVPGTYTHLTTSPEAFRNQMEWLREHGFTAIHPADWVRWVRGEADLPEKPVLITLDDAFCNQHEHALPILQELSMPALVFVVSNEIGGSNRWDQANGCAPIPCMDKAQLTHWSNAGVHFAGVHFGGHSCSHADLTKINKEQLSLEVEESHKMLMELQGSTPTTSPLCFAYPYGAWNENVREEVAKQFDLAFTTESGINDCTTPFLTLKRLIVVRSHSLWSLRKMVWVGWSTPFLVSAWNKVKLELRQQF
jgi:peptidoglycan/xylan/chitin deacetylase (PgdA/CDA1 family)